MDIDWNMSEMFTGPNGKSAVRYAVSIRDGVHFELSMHDPTIQKMVSHEFWLPAFAAQRANARVEIVRDTIRDRPQVAIICGFGKPNDPMGNLILYRISPGRGYSPERLIKVVGLVAMSLLAMGIRLDRAQVLKRFEDVVRSN